MNSSPATYPLSAIGLLLGLLSFFLFYNVGQMRGWDSFSFFIFSIVLFVACVICFKAAYKSQQKYAADIKSLAEAHGSRVEYEKHDVALESVRIESQLEAEVRKMRQEVELVRLQVERMSLPVTAQTEVMRQLVEQRELQLRQQYIEPARQQGISVDQYMAVNEHWNRRLIDVEIERREFENIDYASLESEHEVVWEKVNQKLLSYAKEIVAERQKVYHSDLPIEEKKATLELYVLNSLGLINELSKRGVISTDDSEKILAFFTNHRDGMVNDNRPITASSKRWDLAETETALKYGRTTQAATKRRKKTQGTKTKNSNDGERDEETPKDGGIEIPLEKPRRGSRG